MLFAVDDDKPVVIAMPPFCDYSGSPDTPHFYLALRDQVAAQLIKKYNCIVLSRSNGIILSTENKLSVLNSINQEDAAPPPLPAADYAVACYFQIGKKAGSGVWHEGTILFSDLRIKRILICPVWCSRQAKKDIPPI